jgi:signal transduction histidine kinase
VGVEIVRELSEPLPGVQADTERILQVLWNLTGNAIKFTPKGGRVFVRAEEAGDEVLFSITDTGPGIAPEHIDRLFDPFWQDKRTARLGTGLGLPISRAIVEAHGGRIWAESTVGEGATFAFTLPRAERSA